MNRKLKVFLVVLFFGFFALVTTPFYLALNSSIPLNWIADQMRSKGYVVEGVEGNFRNGFSVQKIAKNSPEANFLIEHLNFKYSSILELFTKRKMIIEDISSDHMAIEYKVDPSAKKNEKPKEEKKEAVAKKDGGSKSKFNLEEFVIKRIRFAKVQVKAPWFKEERVFDEILLTDFIAKPDQFEIKRINVASNVLEFTLESMKSDGKIFKTEKDMVGKFKKAIHPMLIADLDFRLGFEFDAEKKTSKGEMHLLGDKVLVAYNPAQGLVLETKEFTVSEVVQEPWPVKSLNFKFEAKTVAELLAGNPHVVADFKVGATVFKSIEYAPNAPRVPGLLMTAVGEEGGHRIEIDLKPPVQKIMMTMSPGGFSDWFIVRSKPLRSNKDLFSRVLYRKPFYQVSDEEKKEVEVVMPYFTSENPEVALEEAPKRKGVLARGKSVGVRQPASFQKGPKKK